MKDPTMPNKRKNRNKPVSFLSHLLRALTSPQGLELFGQLFRMALRARAR